MGYDFPLVQPTLENVESAVLGEHRVSEGQNSHHLLLPSLENY